MAGKTGGVHEGETVERSTAKVGTYTAYAADGTVLWTKDDFEVGVDAVPPGLSIGMKAGRLVDSKGNVITKWDPGRILPGIPI